uniref:Tetraspanin 10 n=1 Tax=Neogobius melanostomus TaxID=47308 RepID=A0A8C6T6R0_9GOBI
MAEGRVLDYFLKYFLFFCNLLFTVLGLIVLGLGMWGLISKESFAQEKIGSIGTDPMLLLVSLGFLLFMLCLTGCVGALRENSCLLKVFSAVVLALIAAQVVMAILVYSLQDQIGNYLRSGMLTAMGRYQDDLDLRFIMDEVQSNLQCCGADTYPKCGVARHANCSIYLYIFFKHVSNTIYNRTKHIYIYILMGNYRVNSALTHGPYHIVLPKQYILAFYMTCGLKYTWHTVSA